MCVCVRVCGFDASKSSCGQRRLQLVPQRGLPAAVRGNGAQKRKELGPRKLRCILGLEKPVPELFLEAILATVGMPRRRTLGRGWCGIA